ncbi:MAG: exostosin family protein [Candidatus Omnitrophota bacterium]
MKIAAYNVELFDQERVPTESSAFRLLKQTPIARDITYLAVPWSIAINRNKLSEFAFEKSGRGFTICQHLAYEKIIPLLKRIKINVLFTPHVRKTYWGIKVMPFPHYAVNGIGPAEKKHIFYNFIGIDSTTQISSSLRRRLFQMRHPADAVVIEREFWHWDREMWGRDVSEKTQQQEKEEYQDILAHSRFSLCPRGAGASTIRFWESLQAGAIPVLLSDAMRLPEGIKWDECIVRIKEKHVERITDVLKQISTTQESYMRKKCVEAYRLFSGANLVSNIRRFYRDTAR